MNNQDGTYSEKQGFLFDWNKIAQETGYTIEEIKARGIAWCRNNPKKGK